MISLKILTILIIWNLIHLNIATIEFSSDYYVNLHNKIRAHIKPPARNMLKMNYDEDMEKTAMSIVRNCSLIKLFNGKKQPNMNYYVNTKNMSRPLEIDRPFIEWTEGVNHYNLQTNKCYGNTHKCEQYLQIISSDVEYVGCAESICVFDEKKTAIFTACSYYSISKEPLLSTIPYEQGRSCSNCPLNRRGCLYNLCINDGK